MKGRREGAPRRGNGESGLVRVLGGQTSDSSDDPAVALSLTINVAMGTRLATTGHQRERTLSLVCAIGWRAATAVVQYCRHSRLAPYTPQIKAKASR